jgi:hypothetical protein
MESAVLLERGVTRRGKKKANHIFGCVTVADTSDSAVPADVLFVMDKTRSVMRNFP